MADPKVVVGIVVGVVLYAGFLTGMIALSLRWSRRVLKKKTDVLMAGLTPAGAKQIGQPQQAGLYRGAETEYEIGSRRVFVNSYYVSRSFIRANMRINGGPYPFLIIYPEGKVERFGKAIGLNREVQTGDKAFDDLAYLDTFDSNENVAKLMAPAAVRAGVTELLNMGYKVQFSTRGVEAFQVVYVLTPLEAANPSQAVEALGRLADAAPAFPGVPLAEPRSLKRLAYGMALVFSGMLGMVAAVACSRAIQSNVDVGGKALAFLVGGGVAWALYVVMLSVLTHGRSYAFRVVMFGAFMGLFGMPAGGGALVIQLNQSLDSTAAVEHPVVVVDRRSYKGNRTLVVPSWYGGGTVQVNVSHTAYDTTKIGDSFVLHAHPGAFGMQWLE